jgi:hypothetical protein
MPIHGIRFISIILLPGEMLMGYGQESIACLFYTTTKAVSEYQRVSF